MVNRIQLAVPTHLLSAAAATTPVSSLSVHGPRADAAAEEEEAVAGHQTQQSQLQEQKPQQHRKRKEMSADGLKAMSDLADAADKSRQKSCNACVRSKRRCDKRTPRCTRCNEKNFSCVYQNLPPASANGSSGIGGGSGGVGVGVGSLGGRGDSSSSAGGMISNPDDTLQAMDIEEDCGNINDDLPPFDFNTLTDHHLQHQQQHHHQPQLQQQQPTPASSSSYLDGGLPTIVMTEDIHTGIGSGNNSGSNIDNATSVPSTSSLNLDLNAANAPFDFNSVMDFLNADPTAGGELQLWETPLTPIVQKTMLPEINQLSPCDWDNEMGEACGGFQPWQIHEPNSRIGHLVNIVKNMHVVFAQTKQTPFLHRHLYRGVRETPRPLMAAYTAISAYAGMTESNKDWAIRAVCEGANEILKSGAGAGNAKDSTTTSTSTTAAAAAAAAAVGSNITGHEKLARAQALFLIQTVRCFDGDIALRAQAERDMGVLEKWLKDLEGLRDNFDEVHLLDDGALRGRPPRSWEVWIFNECVRRTVLMGYVFTSMYQMLKSAGDFDPDLAPWLIPHRWTFSKHLWDAQSSPTFFTAWREKPMFLVNSFFVQGVAKIMRPADVDDFARMFLTM
ncbi:uncharacterized protein N0V96_004108 [Colletotrichum fioriniae]|uniref:uncharacterized protein n=1 Tax=Colletotrichum fioriniae TaxID=710243 RepID=UPI002301D7FA|nr:uncharacterized protein COL516b_001103 [Colletotrichum fioriniae]KAJ0312039.1 hypothetical protein COL516b_001103 [Colletotrichum fioriniae]KAJ3945768.1 hypothetical protein N0V96_004108 [Colletotrichum fioriniae]